MIFIRLIGILVGLALFGLAVIAPLGTTEQAILGAVVFAFCLAASGNRGRRATTLLIVVSVFVSTRYLHWRLTDTLNLEATYELVFGYTLLGAEIFAYAILLLGYFQALSPLRRDPLPLPIDASRWPTVDVYIPTYNEPLSVVKATILAAKALDWPREKLRVFVLDDGRREEFRQYAVKAGVGYLTRGDNQHAKAGNLNEALKKTRGEFIAIFDCDQVPVRSFLQMTMGWLVADANIGVVQTPHQFYSPDPFERNLGTFRKMPNEGDLFYGVVQGGNDFWDATFFCGSCAVIRRAALDDIGGFATETVTEDAHTSLRMQRKGWSASYINVPQAAGLATENLGAHIGQRQRWARGMAQIFRIDNPLLGRGLSLSQRLCYSAATMYFLFGLPRLVFLVAPLFYLLLGAHVFNAAPTMVLAYALPHLFHAMLTTSRIQGNYRHSFWAEVYETVLAPYAAVVTTVALVAPRIGGFNVTAKGGLVESDYFDRRHAMPSLVLFGGNLLGFAMGIYLLVTNGVNVDVVYMNLTWAAYNMFILGAGLAVARERRQRRSSWRIPLELPAFLEFNDGFNRPCTLRDISFTGAGVVTNLGDDVPVGWKATLTLCMDGDYYPLPVSVVRSESGRLGLAFDELTLAEEEWLVRVAFSRADAWWERREQVESDRPLRSLLSVASHAIDGMKLLVTLLPSTPGGKRSLPSTARPDTSPVTDRATVASGGA